MSFPKEGCGRPTANHFAGSSGTDLDRHFPFAASGTARPNRAERVNAMTREPLVIVKIAPSPAMQRSCCFALHGCRSPLLSGSKARPAILSPAQNDPVTRRQNKPADARTRGVRWGCQCMRARGVQASLRAAWPFSRQAACGPRYRRLQRRQNWCNDRPSRSGWRHLHSPVAACATNGSAFSTGSTTKWYSLRSAKATVTAAPLRPR